MQQGQNKLIGYASKSLPKACVNYGITELEMTGLLVNMENWRFYLGRKDFDAAVDHRAIPYIMKSKELPTTDRIIRILQRLGRFNFHLYYVKGKDMILCDFLSRIKSDDSDPNHLIPIAFHQMELVPLQYNPNQILEYFYALEELGYNILEEKITQENCYMVMTRRAAKETGTKVPEVHGANKLLDPDLIPEKDKGLQKHVITQPANVKPIGPVAIASGPTPATPHLPSTIPQVKLPVKIIPKTPVTPPRMSTLTPRMPHTPVQTRPENLPFSTPLIPTRTGPKQPVIMTPIKTEITQATPRKQLFTPKQTFTPTPGLTPDLSRVKKEPLDIPRFDLGPDPLDQKPSIPAPETSFIHPTFQAPQQSQTTQASVHDLKGDPWLDPKMEPPLEESAVDAFFRHPLQEDFIIPPTLAEATKNKTLLAKDLPKQTDID